MATRNELLADWLTALGGTPEDSDTRNELLDKIAAEVGAPTGDNTRNNYLALILTFIGGDPENDDTRNELLEKTLEQYGVPINGTKYTRNELLQLIADNVPVVALWSADSIIITADSIAATADGLAA